MKAISADSNSPSPERAWERVTGRRHSDCFQPEDSLRTIIVVGSTQAQNEIHPIVYKFPSIPPFHSPPQIKAALALHRLPLEQGWLCSKRPHSIKVQGNPQQPSGRLCWFALALGSVGGMGLCSTNSEILALTLVAISKQTELKITMASWWSECQFASILGWPTWQSPLT